MVDAYAKTLTDLAYVLGVSRKNLDKFRARSNNPGKVGEGYPVAAWRAYINAESDASNELKRARYELLQLQIEKLRGDLVPSKLFLDCDEKREADLVRVVEQFRQTELGKCRDPMAAKVIDERWDNFRTAVADAIESNRKQYIADVGRAAAGEMETAAEADGDGVGEAVG